MRDLEAEWMAAMRRGDDEAAWAVNDCVLAGRDKRSRDDPALPYHRRWVWSGADFRGRDVLVRCYHGLGDTLQYARFLHALRPLVASLTVEVQPELLPVLAGPPALLVPFVPHAPRPPSDCDMEIMELSHALRLGPGAVRPPYLSAGRAELPAGSIGLCWQAGGWDRERCVPPGLMAPWAAARPAVSLVPGATALPVLNPGGTGDLASTAALIAGVDLVITVDTMVAHLAGALGRPCWVLLKHGADWRWGEDGPESAWYPSARLYRQARPGDWSGVVAEVTAGLAARG